MNQLEIDFIYQGARLTILCSEKDLMKDIIKRYSIKSKIEINSIFFLYSGDKINENLTLEKIIKNVDKNKKKLEILVCSKEENQRENHSKVKSTQVICPECGEIALINFKNYNLSISRCKKNHKFEKILLGNFDKTQIIDESKIICENCRTVNKSTSFNKVFFICLFCKKNLCPLCKTSHDKNHYIIKYEEKDSLCFEHRDNYNLYCKTCNKNLCISCENDHPGHEIISLGRLIPKEQNLNKKINDLKDSIFKFKEEINNIINILNKVKDNIDKCYKISKDIMKSFNIRIKNYEMLLNINEISNFDDTIMKNIDKIIKEQKVYYKIMYIFNIYCMMNSEEDKIIKKEILEKNNSKNNIMELNNITYFNYLYSKKKPIKKEDDDENKNDEKKDDRNNINMNNMMNNMNVNNMMNNMNVNNMMNNMNNANYMNNMNHNMNMNNMNNTNLMNNMMSNMNMNNMSMNNMMNNMNMNNMSMNNMMNNMNMNNMSMNNMMNNMNMNNMNMNNMNMNNMNMNNMMNNINGMYSIEKRILKEYSSLKSKKLTIIDFIGFIKNLKKENIPFYDFLYPEIENILNIDLGFNGINLSNNNIFEWEFTLKGPKYSPYSGGLFHLKAFFPKNYPDSPPEICFITPIYHLEVNHKYFNSLDAEKLGHICSPILNWWNPKTTMKELILSIFPFFYSQIMPDSPYGLDRAEEFFNNNSLFERKIKFFTQKYADPSLPYKEYNNSWDFSYTE